MTFKGFIYYQFCLVGSVLRRFHYFQVSPPLISLVREGQFLLLYCKAS